MNVQSDKGAAVGGGDVFFNAMEGGVRQRSTTGGLEEESCLVIGAGLATI